MSVKLQKGQKVSLSKDNAGLSRIIVGLGWDEVQQQSRGFFAPKPQPIDCDAFALLLQNGKLLDTRDVVYFGNLTHMSGAVKHMGDNLTGAGDGDDEQIMIDLNAVPAQYDRIVLAVNIYQAHKKNQHFGMIQNAFIRLVDARNNNEMCIYNLTENYSGQTAMLFGEVYRHNGEWKFNAVGQGTTDGSIGDFAKRYM
ncbi:MAG TPA: TerD family protein [Candidatus Lachnoclostridium stercoravium]|uniref:TerD family protein n=1 Tax=Candidatus Lachnoclostridium stercoravium TaxID=2838633 RepID=A0A9D2HG66_9FIRM|nr:TerD family protein [Candidatus Lachnoclostridium stercoravium]